MQRSLQFLVFLCTLRGIHTRIMQMQPRLRVAHGHVQQAELNVPCLSKDFDGTWIPEMQLLTGGSLIKGPCLLQHSIVVYHQNKLHFTVDDKDPVVGEDITFAFYGVNASFARMKHSEAVEVCKGAMHFHDVPVVIAQRDTPNMYHILNIQLIPIFAALREFGMEESRFQIVFLNDWDYRKVDYNATERWLGFFEVLSGGITPITPATMPSTFCASTTIVGPTPHGPGLRLSNTDKMDYLDEHFRSKELMREFVRWVLRGHGLVQGNGHSDPPKLLIIERVAPDARQMHGAEHLENYASDQGWIVQKIMPSTTSIKDQLKAVISASVLVTIHGAAFALAAFLPRKAVAVELMPYGFVPGNDFYAGYANWLDMAGISHMVWHEQDTAHHVDEPDDAANGIIRCGKQTDLWLGYLDAVQICEAAHIILKTPLIMRTTLAGQVMYLNRPAILHC